MRPRKLPKEGQIPEIGAFRSREDGKFTEGMASTVRSAFNAVISKINGRLTFGDGEQGSWTGNIDGYCKDVVFPSVADTELQILHELGRPPRFYIVAMQDRAGDVYVSNYAGWSSQNIYLKSSVADLSCTLLLF